MNNNQLQEHSRQLTGHAHVIGRIIGYVWSDPTQSIRSKLELALVCRQFFSIISSRYTNSINLHFDFKEINNPFNEPVNTTSATDIVSHINSPYCLLKTVRRVTIHEAYDEEYVNKTNLDVLSTHSNLIFGHVEELVFEKSTPTHIVREHFDNDHNTALTSIRCNILNWPADDVLRFLGAMPRPLSRLQSLTLCLAKTESDASPIAHQLLPQLNHLIVRGASWPSLACDGALLKGLETLVLGSNRQYYEEVCYRMASPATFFEALKQNTRLRVLELWLSNSTQDNDYKPAFIDYLISNGASLQSLTVGFIRDRAQVEVIASKLPQLQHLQLETNESDIVFAPATLRSLILSSRSDRNIYYSVRSIRDHVLQAPLAYPLTSLHLRFYQFYHTSSYVTIRMLPTLLSGVASLQHLTIDLCGGLVEEELVPAIPSIVEKVLKVLEDGFQLDTECLSYDEFKKAVKINQQHQQVPATGGCVQSCASYPIIIFEWQRPGNIIHSMRDTVTPGALKHFKLINQTASLSQVEHYGTVVFCYQLQVTRPNTVCSCISQKDLDMDDALDRFMAGFISSDSFEYTCQYGDDFQQMETYGFEGGMSYERVENVRALYKSRDTNNIRWKTY
ncbi:hypothetical protein SAMD00019534_095290 [Acytostelium subglobosum LB1]|uniref:hypothetical protein n=1 Tax=Acytostelium subglobosum LB1 TaxID=1410327 RepID=UPI000644D5E5|nr:hypothetical protein SAMD00019534_095290 [Acytostelium subglobosum LB1]GAM26354.1 hypothetical protein SAMD00019534_095290 [Acytostelium subglobosum LB1]|eukprot:XP_012750908.1 hypothetical protein SAMD00019534_095290 [Acytostelium subglobosum LB1]